MCILPLVEINLYTRDALPFQWRKDCVTDEEDDEKIRKSLVRKNCSNSGVGMPVRLRGPESFHYHCST